MTEITAPSREALEAYATDLGHVLDALGSLSSKHPGIALRLFSDLITYDTIRELWNEDDEPVVPEEQCPAAMATLLASGATYEIDGHEWESINERVRDALVTTGIITEDGATFENVNLGDVAAQVARIAATDVAL